MTTPLILKLSGPPEVTFKEQPLKFRSRKVLALLIYLVVEQGVHSRDKIAAMFWPESDQERARASFRNTLLRLRQSLAPAGEYLLVDAETIRFDVSQPHQIVSDAPGAFLEGFALPDAPEFDYWVSVQREAHLRRLSDRYNQRSAEQLHKRHFQDAVTTATAWLALDPLDETAARRLMKAHALAGNRSAALSVYAALEQALARELDVPPSAETKDLAASIRRAPAPADSDSQSPQASLPFVGRANEHRQLVSAYEEARAGHTCAICVEGEAGIGKTRLVEVFFAWASLQGPLDILRGRAFEMGGRLPYQALVDALRLRLDAENAPDDLLADIWLAELSQLLPELRDRYPDLPQALGGNPEFTRSRLFEAVAALGQAVAARKTTVLFIDDIQWADPGTLDLLLYLARRWHETHEPILFIWSVRAENLATSRELKEWLAHMGRSIPTTRIELAPLQGADVRQLVEQLPGAAAANAQATAAFSHWLQDETAGQPFFVVEMLKMLEDQHILVAGDVDRALRKLHRSGHLPVPRSVRELILTRVGRLSEEAAVLLLAAAVVGREASFERLAEIANLDALRGLNALEALIAGRLLVETNMRARPYRFAHDNIRDVVYTAAGEARRRYYHRRAFTSLQASAAAAELAFHAHAAGLPEPALAYSQAAGQEALDKYAFAEAIIHFARAFELMDDLPVPSSQRQLLYTLYGRALELNGRYADALAHYQHMGAAAQRLHDPTLQLAALVAESTIYVTANDQNDIARGEIVCAEALALARELHDETLEATIQWNLLNVYRMTGRNDLAMAAGERSLQLARKLDLREQLAYTTNDLGYVYQAKADIENMNRVLELSTSLWRELRNLPMLTDSLTSYANNLVFVGAMDQALAVSAEAQSISRALKNPWSESFTLFTPCFVHWYRLEVPQALAAMRRCVALAREVGFVGGLVTMSNYQAQLLLSLGEIDQAREVMQGIRATAERRIPLFLSGASAAAAMIALHEDDLAAAAALLEPFLAGPPPFDLMNCFMLEFTLCNYWRRLQSHDRLRQYADQLINFLAERQLITFLPQFLYMRALALCAQKQHEAALADLQSAADINKNIGAAWMQEQILALQTDLRR